MVVQGGITSDEVATIVLAVVPTAASLTPRIK